MSARFIVGDVMDTLRGMADSSVDMVFTSPPFLGLRSYLPADHPLKDKEIGTELNPGQFIDTLLDVTEELARVLAPHGSICIELGDTYAGGNNGPDAHKPEGGHHDLYWEKPRSSGEGWPEGKSLCLIPELYRVALVYGVNALTGRTTPKWRARNVVRWCRPNPAVGALSDKVRPATSDIIIACKSKTRFYDLDAARHTPLHGLDPAKKMSNGLYKGHPSQESSLSRPDRVSNAAGAPPLDHWWIDDVLEQDAWLIPTSPYKGSHYATFPPALVVKPLLMMCPERVCTVCGQPSRRLVVRDEKATEANLKIRNGRAKDGRGDGVEYDGYGDFEAVPTITVGWSDCGHDAWRSGIILDPFAGSGTVLSVASGHGRDSIGIDLDDRNADLAQQRVGMFLTVERRVVV
jgi:site-specific DNA-methyltransferase (adenine-specific)